MNIRHEPATVSCPIELASERGTSRRRFDLVAVEAPLEVRFWGNAATVLMRTPGEDEGLVRGSCSMMGSYPERTTFFQCIGLRACLIRWPRT